MRTLTALPIAATVAASLLAACPAHAGDDRLDPKITAFDKRMFGGSVGDKASACFVRRYDARHLAQHPKQKVSLLKLLITAEKAPGEPTSYASPRRPAPQQAGKFRRRQHLRASGGRRQRS
jgi:hypothetical protein